MKTLTLTLGLRALIKTYSDLRCTNGFWRVGGRF